MKVQALVEHDNEYGVRDGGSYAKKVGDTYEVDDAEAKHLIAAGLVEKAADASQGRGAK